jgi:hypothetical protein
MKDIYGIGDFLFAHLKLIKEILELIFSIFFTFATFFVVFIIQFACVSYILKTGEIVLSEPYGAIALYTMFAFAVGCAVIVNVNYDKLFNLKNSKNE